MRGEVVKRLRCGAAFGGDDGVKVGVGEGVMLGRGGVALRVPVTVGVRV